MNRKHSTAAWLSFFLDLDNFKIINDSLGHEVGDIVLSESGWRIQEALRSDDIVCRLGGDEFTAIIKGVKSKESIQPGYRCHPETLSGSILLQ